MLKEQRESKLLQYENYRSVHSMIESNGVITQLFEEEKPDVVIHLAAQAGLPMVVSSPHF